MESLMSLNLSQSRPLVSICDTKYLVLSLWQNARPSSISNLSISHVSCTAPSLPFFATCIMMFSADLTLAAKICASRFSVCTSAAACATPATTNAMGATQGSCLAKERSALPTAPAALPMPPRASDEVAPASRAPAPTSAVPAASPSEIPVSMPRSHFSSLDSFLRGGFFGRSPPGASGIGELLPHPMAAGPSEAWGGTLKMMCLVITRF